MRINDAKLNAGWLCLEIQPVEAIKWLSGFVSGKDWQIIPITEKRSRNANSYAWELIGQIVIALNKSANKDSFVTKEDVYKYESGFVSGTTLPLTIKKDAYDAFVSTFVSGHIARNVEIIGEYTDAYDVIVTYGSSDYDKKQMSQLINAITADCKTLGIPTLEDKKMEALIESWGK